MKKQSWDLSQNADASRWFPKITVCRNPCINICDEKSLSEMFERWYFFAGNKVIYAAHLAWDRFVIEEGAT